MHSLPLETRCEYPHHRPPHCPGISLSLLPDPEGALKYSFPLAPGTPYVLQSKQASDWETTGGPL